MSTLEVILPSLRHFLLWTDSWDSGLRIDLSNNFVLDLEGDVLDDGETDLVGVLNWDRVFDLKSISGLSRSLDKEVCFNTLSSSEVILLDSRILVLNLRSSMLWLFNKLSLKLIEVNFMPFKLFTVSLLRSWSMLFFNQSSSMARLSVLTSLFIFFRSTCW